MVLENGSYHGSHKIPMISHERIWKEERDRDYDERNISVIIYDTELRNG
jgi:hypothetical protein